MSNPQVQLAIPAFTLQPQSFPKLWPVLVNCPAEGRRLSGWLCLGGVYT